MPIGIRVLLLAFPTWGVPPGSRAALSLCSGVVASCRPSGLSRSTFTLPAAPLHPPTVCPCFGARHRRRVCRSHTTQAYSHSDQFHPVFVSRSIWGRTRIAAPSALLLAGLGAHQLPLSHQAGSTEWQATWLLPFQLQPAASCRL